MNKNANRVKQIFDNVITIIISNAIIVLASTGSAGVALLVSRHLSFTNLETGLMISTSVLIILIVSYLIYRKKNKRIPIYAPIECDFHVIREERVHKWLNETDYIHKRRYELKALRNGLTEYVDKFQWTGKEYSLSGGDRYYSIEEDKQSRNVFTVYHFKFQRPMKKGETIRLEATWTAKGPAKPFFSTTIEKPTDTLVMSVMLFPESGVTEVNCEECSNIGAMLPIDNTIQKLNSDGEYVWELKPKILHHYEINWTENNNNSN